MGAAARGAGSSMARSGKLRSGAAAKLKRWRKGHSSDSNPETRQHRLAARSRFCSRPAGKGRGRRLLTCVRLFPEGRGGLRGQPWGPPRAGAGAGVRAEPLTVPG